MVGTLIKTNFITINVKIVYFNYSFVSPASDCNVNYSVVTLPTEDICTSIILLSVKPQIVI